MYSELCKIKEGENARSKLEGNINPPYLCLRIDIFQIVV